MVEEDKWGTHLVGGEVYEQGLLGMCSPMKVQRIKQLGGNIHSPTNIQGPANKE